MRVPRQALAFLLMLLAGARSSFADPLEYRPGRGLRLGSSGLVVGGFTNIKAEATEQTGGEFALDSLDVLLIFDRFTRFRAVAELQLSDIFVASEDATGAPDFAFDVRRLFGDFTVSDELHVRAGTFLTPVGYWNLILAPPLTWTTEAPLIVRETFFQETTTGVMLHGSTGVANGQLGYSLFSQFLRPLADNPDLDPPNLTAGIRLTYDTSFASSLGVTYQAAETGGAWSQLGAVDLFWQFGRGEVLSELYVLGGDALTSTQWGAYLQGVYEIYGPLYGVARYEHFDQQLPLPTLDLLTLGAVLKPLPFTAIKVEYRFVSPASSSAEPSGFFSSFSLLF